MSNLEKVKRFKELNNIPYSKDEIEYWGPVDEDFSTVFYKIGNAFISNHYTITDKNRKTELNRLFTLLLTNIVYYSKKSSEGKYPYVYFNLNHKQNVILSTVAIQLESNCFEQVQAEVSDILSITKEDLKQMEDNSLTDLHLLMRLADSSFEGEIIEKGPDHWLSFKLKLT